MQTAFDSLVTVIELTSTERVKPELTLVTASLSVLTMSVLCGIGPGGVGLNSSRTLTAMYNTPLMDTGLPKVRSKCYKVYNDLYRRY